jgi:transcriptional antiterminator RfaH
VIEQGLYRGIEAIWQCPDGDKRSLLLIELMQTQISVSFSNKEFYKALNS